MLLHEAALRAGIAAPAPLLGRPTCMALPASLAQGVIASTGCVGNRVYTDVGEDELYVMIPGKDVARVAAEAQTIASANLKLSDYHRERRRPGDRIADCDARRRPSPRRPRRIAIEENTHVRRVGGPASVPAAQARPR